MGTDIKYSGPSQYNLFRLWYVIYSESFKYIIPSKWQMLLTFRIEDGSDELTVSYGL
jgi:hypothetical protein